MDNNQNAVDIFNKRASGYRDKFMDVSLYADGLDLFCRSLPAGAGVLELACGPGNITKHLLSKRPDLKILATDLAPNMLEIAKKENPLAQFQLLDCRKIMTLGKKFHGVLAGFCLPYLTENECAQLIQDAGKLLHDGGILYLSTMEADAQNTSGTRTSSYGDSMFIHFHSEEFLAATLSRFGFLVERVDRKSSVMTNGERVTDLVLIYRK